MVYRYFWLLIGGHIFVMVPAGLYAYGTLLIQNQTKQGLQLTVSREGKTILSRTVQPAIESVREQNFLHVGDVISFGPRTCVVEERYGKAASVTISCSIQNVCKVSQD